MDVKIVTIVIMLVFLVGLVGWDIYVVTNGSPGATISEIMLVAAKLNPIIPFALGIVAGHLFWPQR